MNGYARIDGSRVEVTDAELTLYHCASDEADWNLELRWGGQSVWLSGTVTPAPKEPAALEGARLRVEPRDLDQLLRAIQGRGITAYPRTEEQVAWLSVRAEGQAWRLSCDFELDWDRGRDAPGAQYPSPRTASVDVKATLGALHPQKLP